MVLVAALVCFLHSPLHCHLLLPHPLPRPQCRRRLIGSAFVDSLAPRRPCLRSPATAGAFRLGGTFKGCVPLLPSPTVFFFFFTHGAVTA